MLKEVASFDHVWLKMHRSSKSAKAIVSFIRFLEQKLGAEFVYDQSRIGYESMGLTGLLELAEELRARNIIRSYGRKPVLPDEPRTAYWYAEYEAEKYKRYARSGGSSLDDHSLALAKTLAEAMERHTWFMHDRFSSIRSATVAEMENIGNFLHPSRFAGYSESQRRNDSHLELKLTDSFLWVEGYSWAKKGRSWVPAQIVSGCKKFLEFKSPKAEPMIRPWVTSGLATHPSRTEALLSGALEVIERDAYIITWLNQLSPPRMDPGELSLRTTSLARLIALCRRYRLEPYILRLPTDAPAYAVCTILEDTTGTLPRFSVGLKANRDPACAAEGAILEALRAHLGTRTRKLSPQDTWDPKTKTADIVQYERLMYWAEGTRGDHLAFLTKGDIQPLAREVWESDTDEEHFARIVQWCEKQGYELVSVSFMDAEANIPGWHIEFVVIPEMQPLYYNEKFPCLGGKRLHDIPKQFGYALRKPYLDDPHPFA